MEKANIERINYFTRLALTRLARERDLTAEEQAERQKCRAAYLKAFRTQMRAQLTQTIVEYPDGTCMPLTETTKKK